MAKNSPPAFQNVDSRVNPDQLERNILKFWEAEQIFVASLKQSSGHAQFTFYDGPPYATGKPHYGHVLQSALKDAVLRYKTMRGFHVPRRVGWDTHGLPVEVLVEKELGLKTKKDVEGYGIEKFNAKCREAVFRYIDEFTATLKRLGRWADYDNGYATLDRDYMESEWWAFKELWDRGLIYQANRSTPYCIRCETPLSNFEVSTNYRDKTDPAVYVKLPIDHAASSWSNPADEERYATRKLYLLVWTTTPWTLPANVAVAYSPSIAYVVAEQAGEDYLLAKDRVESVLGAKAKIVKTWNPADFKGIRYQPIFPELAPSLPAQQPSHCLVEGAHVTATDGTGLVHMAPAFGEEDAVIAKHNDLPVIRNVTTDGRYTDDVTPWAGQNIFTVNDSIIADLQDRGLLLKAEQHTHSYPFCWRCDTPLIYYALDTWFVKITDIKDRLHQNNEDITWIPEHIKHGRFAKGIESAPDWAVSRNRFWSVPIPIWQCDQCAERYCVGSIAELQELSGAGDDAVKDLHRPYVDDITWPCGTQRAKGDARCPGTMVRTPEVLDVWFDSGAMPYAQWHYPFENKELVENNFPADFIVESIEMTRAWFYTLHVLATALKDQPAFKNVIGSGIIFGEDGNKLSKKLKNYPDVEPTLKKYGADTVRLFFLNSTLGEPYVFSEKELQQLHRSHYLTLWNVYSFFVRYANTHQWTPGKKIVSKNVLDRWMLARVAQIEQAVLMTMDTYKIDQATRYFAPFIDDLSNWYVRRSRNRFQRPAADAEREEAFGTLHEVLSRTSILLAPFMPFIAEEIYRNLTGEKSVHLATYLQEISVDNHITEDQVKIRADMEMVREVVSEGLALRARAGLKIRQPLSQLVIQGDPVDADLAAIMQEELNVKTITTAEPIPAAAPYLVNADDAPLRVALNTEITPALKSEGTARDIIRHGQVLRREAGYALNDRITLLYQTDSDELKSVFTEHADTIQQALQADDISTQAARPDAAADVKINGHELRLGVRKNS